MANEPTTTITGNLTKDPELRFTPAGRPVAAFTIANTPRFPDRATGEWTGRRNLVRPLLGVG